MGSPERRQLIKKIFDREPGAGGKDPELLLLRDLKEETGKHRAELEKVLSGLAAKIDRLKTRLAR